ncbi:MAG: filamentous hemagglutinin N-terminal domain-containing protein [Mesorhizobium sp.]|nr:MAG: filamentous hemagglutinin N-terminal domain-containing protein [Mesorhizobium sp.]
MPLNTSTTPRFHAGSEFDLGGMAIKHMGGPRWRHACDLVLQPTLASASGSMRQPVAQLISGLQCRNTGPTLNSINEVSRTTVGCLIQAIQAAVILNEVTSTRASALNGMMQVHGMAATVIFVDPNGISCNRFAALSNTQGPRCRQSPNAPKRQLCRASLLSINLPFENHHICDQHCDIFRGRRSQAQSFPCATAFLSFSARRNTSAADVALRGSSIPFRTTSDLSQN